MFARGGTCVGATCGALEVSQFLVVSRGPAGTAVLSMLVRGAAAGSGVSPRIVRVAADID